MKLPEALTTWDYRPLARTLVWCVVAGAAVRYYRVPLPAPAAVARELLLGWIVRPATGRASFAVNFIAALAVQFGIVLGAVRLWRAADAGPRMAGLLESALRAAFG